MARDTGAAKLPALPVVATGNVALDRLLRAICERLEVREGSRGNPYERTLLVRDIAALGVDPELVAGTRGRTLAGTMAPGDAAGRNGAKDLSNEAFSEAIRNSRLYQHLLASLNDPARFKDLPEKIQELLTSIADEARKRGADIRDVEMKIQSATESLAYRLTEITAAVDQAQSGVRQLAFSSANANNATAGIVNQVQARLDGFELDPDMIDSVVYPTLAALTSAVPLPSQALYYQVVDPDGGQNLLYRWDGSAWWVAGRGNSGTGQATLEQSMIATADRVKGVSAEYMVKVAANGASAGFGLAASEDPEGNTESAFIVQAGKFAVVADGETIADPKNPPLNRIPFGIDTATDTVYINGQLRISGPTGPTLEEALGEGTVSIRFVTRQFFRYSKTGGAFDSTLTLVAEFSGYLSSVTPAPKVTWEVISGYSGTLPAAGTSNTLVLNEPNMTDESAEIKATYTADGVTLSDTVTVLKVRNGVDGVAGILSNEAHTLPSSSAGVVSSWAGAGGKFTIFRGGTTTTADVTFSVESNPSGVTVSIDSVGNYSATAAGSWPSASNVATVTLRATLPEGVIDKVFTLTKSIAGVAGAQGPATYSWIAYANNSSGTVDFTTGAPGSRTYIGIAYNKSTPTESTNPADYEWSLFQGPSGAPGTNGLDGAASVTASSTAASAGAVSEASRNSLFTSNAGRAPQVGDALTLHNQTAKWSQTWVHSGLSWGAATLYIDGNAVITGTLYADTISTSKVVIRPIGAYIGSSIAITSGYLTVTLVTTSAVSTPLWSYAIYVFDNVIATASWVNNTSTTCTFSIKAWDMTTNTPYTGTIGNLKIWMF